MDMKKFVGFLTIAGAALMASAPAYAAVRLPEPMSMSLVGAGIVAIAAVRHMRRK